MYDIVYHNDDSNDDDDDNQSESNYWHRRRQDPQLLHAPLGISMDGRLDGWMDGLEVDGMLGFFRVK